MTTFPEITHIDTGLHAIQHADGTTRYKIWWQVDGKKRYRALPPRTMIEEARARRDEFYANLMLDGAVAVKHKVVTPRGPKPGGGKYIYKRPQFVVRVRGKQLGEFHTEAEARKVVVKWFAENAKCPVAGEKGKANE